MRANLCCDIHAHFVPPSLVDALRHGPALGGIELHHDSGVDWIVHPSGPRQPLDAELYELDGRLARMDRTGIDVAVVSVSPTLLNYSLDAAAARDWARQVNEELAGLVRESGGRVVGAAHLPMQDPAAAIDEARYAARTLGLRGAQLGPMVLDRGLDEEDHFAVLEALQELDLPVLLHPYFVGAGNRPGLEKYYLTNLAGHPYQTAVGASRLILGGVLDRLPELKLALAHGGGYLPYQIGRLDHGHAVRPEAKRCKRPPSEYLRRFWFDTLTHSTPALQYLVGLVGADRVAYGTDFPYDMGGGSAADQLAGLSLDDDGLRLIRGGNTAALFGLG